MFEMSSIAMSIGFPFEFVNPRNLPENLIRAEKALSAEEFGGEKSECSRETRGDSPVPPDEEFPDGASGEIDIPMQLAGPSCDEVFTLSMTGSSEVNAAPKLPAFWADWPDSLGVGVPFSDNAAERDFLPSEKKPAISIFSRLWVSGHGASPRVSPTRKSNEAA